MNNLSEKLQKYISENTVIVCVGTDKCIGDCLGPLVGTLLTEKGFNFPVYGTLEKPIHALNMDERLSEIYSKHPDALIIGVDACLGSEENIGEIRVRDYAISPGKGVGKELPEIGVASVIGIVDSGDNSEFFFSRSIRLSFIMNKAKEIVEILTKAAKEENSMRNFYREEIEENVCS
ncbi:spore protease YyaC [Candidatus Clostridium helianthi]|uniref:Spore protease YyaC n=1 Tax=Candidatus Clostridium helianthi TaxID=3381660 RepID=A0ABW8S9X4_9CLOT